MTLTSKLILGGIVIVLLPTVSIGVLSTANSSRGMESLFEGQAATMAKSLATMVQMALSQEMNTLKALAVGNGIRQAAEKVALAGTDASAEEIGGLQRRLKAIAGEAGRNYESLVVFDPRGVAFADCMDGKHKGISVAERGYFQAALQGKCSVGDVVLSKASGEPIIPLAVPIYSERKEVVGVLGAILKSDYLLEKIAQVKVGQTGFAVVVNKQGITIAHPDKSVILKHDITAIKGMENLAKGVLAGETGATTYSINGVKKLCSFAPVELTGWSVLVTQTYQELFAPIRSMQKQVLLAGGLLLALVAGLVFVLGRRISMPITRTAQGLSSASDQIVSASLQITSASQQLASGASQQAAAIEEISSSLEEMASMTRQNSENADQANALTAETRAVVGQANQSMEHLTSSMTAIFKSSEETQKIIKTIDEIAFQTNLLALNAAVEAARAGEAGAGFAVVADEVRSLAMRAADASRNTTGLIEEMVQRIREGSATLKSTEDDFTRVAAHTSKVAELMGEISAASREQAQGIAQISKAVSQMDQVVQHNAASAEESASASKEMYTQAEQMMGFTGALSALIGSADGYDKAANREQTASVPDVRLIQAASRTRSAG